MRILVTLIVLAVFTELSVGQTVMSSCNAPDSIISKYKENADRLALRKIYSEGLTFVDSIKIPKAYSDTFLNALIAVYNATSLPARDTVVCLFDIHSWPDKDITSISLSADSNLNWMQQLRNGNIPTGNLSIDSLLTAWSLTSVEKYSDWSGSLSYHTVVLKSDSNYNFPPLTTVFEAHPDVLYAESLNHAGDGNDIVDGYSFILNPPTDHVQLAYAVKWGDCPSGCTSSRIWKFNVYDDCSVEYVGSFGNTLLSIPDTTSCIDTTVTHITNTTTGFSVYPNPFENTLFLKEPNPNYQYSIYNVIGKELLQGQLSENQITDLNILPNGQYFLKIQSDKQVTTFKLIKK